MNYSCKCNAEKGYVESEDKLSCVDVDACTNNPCPKSAVEGSCKDKPAPALNNKEGRTCECTAGLTFDKEDCVEIDACVNNPCKGSNIVCTDKKAPALDDAKGRECKCQAGFTGDATTGCTEAASNTVVLNIIFAIIGFIIY